MQRTIRLLPLALLLSLAGGVACASPVRGFCEAAAECDDREAGFPFGFDFVGESNDSVNVCVTDQEGLLRQLRANEEEDCFEEANAREAYFACVADVYARDAGDACDGLVFDDSNPCEGELEDLFELAIDNGDDCSSSEE